MRGPPPACGLLSVKTEEKLLQVFYDGGCLVCSREIAAYKKMGSSREIHWTDVNAGHDRFIAKGVTRESALRRFHVLTPDGTMLVGVDAFHALWAVLPTTKLLAFALGNGYIRQFAKPFYEVFATIRWMFRRRRAASSVCPRKKTSDG